MSLSWLRATRWPALCSTAPKRMPRPVSQRYVLGHQRFVRIGAAHRAQIVEQHLVGIDDAVPLLLGRAREREEAAAQHRAAADLSLLLREQHTGARLGGADRRAVTGEAAADHQYID
jgi:hypothetical protein